MGGGAQLGLVPQARGAPPLWDGPIWLARESGHVNTVGEPDEGKPHVRFDEGRLARIDAQQSDKIWTSRLLYDEDDPADTWFAADCRQCRSREAGDELHLFR